ncbi:caspase family protein [Streptomyces sp. NPDC003996]
MSESRHALIIANDVYEDPGLRKLSAPGSDADALSEVLRNPEIGDFEVQVLRNASRQDMESSIYDLFSRRGRDDQLLLHFSGHGIKSEKGNLYFAARDTRPERLEVTGVSAHFVYERMSDSRAGCTALLLDCCYGGAFSRGASMKASGDADVLGSFAGEKPSGARGWAVITASDSMQFAFEGSDLTEGGTRPSVFTSAVVEGLRTGDADLDVDGDISPEDLYEYVYDHVREQTPNQTPKKIIEMKGSMQLARSLRRCPLGIEAAPLARDLQDALGSPNVLTRLGAVATVRCRLASSILSLAEGARQALDAVARHDTQQQVVEEARHALDAVRLHPSPDRLDFGPVPRDTPVPRRSVTLQGIPLARHCVAHARAEWLRVDESEEGLTVTVDTSSVGPLSGDITLTGVADEAVVHVTAEVVPPPPPPPTRPPSSKRLWAPALAAATLVLAVTSLVTSIVAVVAAVKASIDRAHAGPTGEFEEYAHRYGLVGLLEASLITALVALLLSALARHELGARREHYAQGARSTTRYLTAAAKRCAIPVVVLGVAMSIAYNVVSGQL